MKTLSCLSLTILAALTGSAQGAEKHTLKYQFTAGEEIFWKVEHLATTETKIRGTEQTSQSRSVSTKRWSIDEIDKDGSITLVHSVDKVEMWQKVSGRPEVRYNSETDETPPPGYEQVAKTVGVPLATVVINAHGHVIKREGGRASQAFGVGEITVPLPEKAVAAGHQWHAPSEIMARLPTGEVKRISTRKAYTLEKVSAGVATITVTTEVLTPVDDPKVKSQLIQQLTHGTIKFDVDAGRVLSTQLDWDETVIGFSGPDSVMKYLARFTEHYQPARTTTASKPSATSVK